jgi:predicted nucleic acid-binding protein
MFALDTNIVSEPRKPRPHGAVIAWYAAHDSTTYVIPSVVFFELQEGALLTRRNDSARTDELDRWIDSIKQNALILPFDSAIARETARLLRRKSPELFVDSVIAATARVYGLTAATRNTHDFKLFDVPQVDPFLFPRS